MRATTLHRHHLIRKEFKARLGTMPVMHLYAYIGQQFGYSEEAIRKILAKKPP